MGHVQTFRNYIQNNFGIMLPGNVILQEKEGVIRICAKSVMRLKPSGYTHSRFSVNLKNPAGVSGSFLKVREDFPDDAFAPKAKKGYMGFVAGKVDTRGIEVKSEFIQLFGKSAVKNIITLTEKQAFDFVEAEYVEMHEKTTGIKVVKFGRHVLGIGKIKDGKLYGQFIGKGRKRVKNRIKE